MWEEPKLKKQEAIIKRMAELIYKYARVSFPSEILSLYRALPGFLPVYKSIEVHR